MAERLPVGAIPSFPALVSNLTTIDASNASTDQFTSQMPWLQADSNGLIGQILSKGLSTPSTHSSAQSRVVHSEATTKNGSKTREGESRPENEWVEQDEPGVYITFVSLPGGVKDLKRVRFSQKRFSEKQAEQWWAENQARVHEQYNVRMAEKSSVGVESEDIAH
ncbi:hypothetical protein Ancab_024633 [Ancistrocladus abbreviatus]